MHRGQRNRGGQLALAPSPTVSGAGLRSGRPSTHRRYRTSDGQTLIGFPAIIIGSLSLGSVLLGYLQGSEIVPMFIVSSLGLVVATMWCAWERKFQTATVFGVFAAFNLSYALLQLGVSNNWYSVPIQDLTNVLSFYSLAWIVVMLILAFVAYNASIGAFGLFVCSIASLALIIWANSSSSLALLKWAALPLGVMVVIAVIFIGQVMWGWRRRNLIEAARLADDPQSPADGPTVLPVLNRRQHAQSVTSE